MSEKMLVTQALDERDLLVKKITDKIAKASFVDTIKPNEDKVYAKRIDKEEYAKEAEASYQQINDLIERFQKIANNTTGPKMHQIQPMQTKQYQTQNY